MQSYVFLSVLALCLGAGQAQVWGFGNCPPVTVQQDFQLNKYLGKWYEMERFFTIFELGQKCVSANYSMKADGTVKVLNEGYNFWGRRTSAEGDAVAEDSSEPAKLGVRFSSAQPRGNYWVLETDYDEYTVVWSCTEIKLFRINLQLGWILTRNREGISDSVKDGIYSRLRNAGIDPSRFSRTNQAGCP